MKRYVLMFLLVLTPLMVFTEEPEPDRVPPYEAYSRGLGFSAGMLSGVGISFRKWHDRLGYQVVAGVSYSSEGVGLIGLNYTDYWVSLEGYRALFSGELAKWLFGQLYLFAAVHHSGYIPISYDYDTEQYIRGSFAPRLRGGVGFGIEVGLFSHFSFVFELGYGAMWEPGSFSIDLIPQGTFQYRF